MSVGINFISKWDPKGIKAAIKSFDEFKASSNKATMGISKGSVAAAAALTALVAASKHALHAAIENEVSQTRFNTVLKNVTNATQEQIAVINEHIAAVSEQSGITRENLRPAMQYLLVATGNVTTAQKDLTLAMDISAATGADLTAVTSALGRAHNGVTRGLIKLDPSLKAVLGTTKDFTKVQQILIDKFGGSEAAFEKTAAGGMRQFSNTIHELWVNLGTALLPVFKAVIPYFVALGNFASNHSRMFVTMAAGVAAFSAAILIANTYLKIMTVWEALVDALNPFTLIVTAIAAVIAIIAALYIKFEGVRTVVNAVINAVIASIEQWANLFIKFYNFLIDAFAHLNTITKMFGVSLGEASHISEISLGRIGGAVKATEKTLMDFRRAEHGVADEIGGMNNQFAGTGKTVKTAAEKLKDYIAALTGVSDANQKVKDATQDVADAQFKVTEAGRAVADANQKVIDATYGVAQAQKNAKKAHDEIAKAQRSAEQAAKDVTAAEVKLKESTDQVAMAQKALDKAIQGVSASSREGINAQHDLVLAQREFEKAGYDVEKAQFDLAKAEADLAAGREDASLSQADLRKLEISAAEAKLSLADAQDAQAKSQDDVSKANQFYNETINGISTDSQQYKDLLRQLNDAKAAEQEAVDNVTEARIKEQDAIAGIQEALDNEEGALRDVEKAQRDLDDAKFEAIKAHEEELKAIRDVEKARRDEAAAILAVGQAERDLAALRGKTPQNIINQAQEQVAAANAAAGLTGTTTTTTRFTTSAIRNKMLADLMPFANGGIVTSPTVGLLAEAGKPEAVIPLDRLGDMGGNIYVTVNAGIGTNGDEVGKQIIDHILRAERRTGKVFARA